jgi:putative addiction module component (TIGR02574 family)
MKVMRHSKLKGVELDETRDSDVEAAWAEEIERRIAEIELGEAETISWEEARTRIRAKLTES